MVTYIHECDLITILSLETLNTNSNFSHELASKELDYNPRKIEESITDVIKSMWKFKKCTWKKCLFLIRLFM